MAPARALHLTPSGVSQHLSKLEAEAGVPLVDRTRRGGGRTLTLTPAGRALADQAEHLATAMSSAERELDRFEEHRGGTVSTSWPRASSTSCSANGRALSTWPGPRVSARAT